MSKNISPNFVAVDVEYANSRQQICQIGVAVVQNFHVVSNPWWYVRPEDNEYEEQFIATHGITPEMTENEPSLEDLWPEIQPQLLNGQLWAHNASTEQRSFEKSFVPNFLSAEWLVFNDSRDLYQRPDCPPNQGNSLQLCCMALGIDFDDSQYHHADYDALKCAEIIIAAAQGRQPQWEDIPKSETELKKQRQGRKVLRLGDFTDYYANTASGDEDVRAVLTSTYPGAPEQEVDVFDKGDRMPGQNKGLVDFARLNMSDDNPVRGKVIVPTGEFLTNRDEIKRALEAMGATHPSSISGNTYAVIVGTNHVGYTKIIDIEEQERKGHHIFRIVGDDDLNELLYGDGRKFFE